MSDTQLAPLASTSSQNLPQVGETSSPASAGSSSPTAAPGLHPELPEILPLLSPSTSPKRRRITIGISNSAVGFSAEPARLSFSKGEGLLPYFRSGQFSDVKLHSADGSLSYSCHRFVLAYSSGYFMRLLQKRRYADAESITLKHVADPSHVFPYVLEYMYRGKVTISTEISIPLLALADRLEMPELKLIISEFIAAHIQRDNAIPMLKRAFRFQSEQIIERCLDVIAVNFCYISVSDYHFMPPEYFLRLLHRERFNVKDEHRLYKMITRYLDSHRKDLSVFAPILLSPSSSGRDLVPSSPIKPISTSSSYPSSFSPSSSPTSSSSSPSSSSSSSSLKLSPSTSSNPLIPSICTSPGPPASLEEAFERYAMMALSAVRWVNMPIRHLKRVIANPLVPKDLIIEALIHRVQIYESPSAVKDVAELRLQKRMTYGITVEFPAVPAIGPDGRGILAWISSNGFTREWKNPHVQRIISVTASSITKGNPVELVGVVPTELWTKDVPASWFCVDLGSTRSVRVTHYTLRHGGNYRADSLRTWDLQGSLDGQSWTLLSRHSNDESLNSAFAVHSWPTLPLPTSFRFFRVLQTGHNSSNHNFLVLSGFELYGELFEGDHETIMPNDDDSVSDSQPAPSLVQGHFSSSSFSSISQLLASNLLFPPSPVPSSHLP